MWMYSCYGAYTVWALLQNLRARNVNFAEATQTVYYLPLIWAVIRVMKTTSEWEADRKAARRCQNEAFGRGRQSPPILPPEPLAAVADTILYKHRWDRPHWRKILQRIASQPDTPPTTLARLMPICPREVAGNPMTPLLFLEQPEWIAEAGGPAAIGPILRLADLPYVIVAGIAAFHPHPEVAEAARLHVRFGPDDSAEGMPAGGVALPAEAEWVPEIGAFWREHAERALGEQQQSYVEAFEAGLVPEWVAGPEGKRPFPRPTPPGKTFRGRATPPPGTTEQIPPIMALQAEASNPETPIKRLRKLAKDKEMAVPSAVAGNPSSTTAVLRRLRRRQVTITYARILPLLFRWYIPPLLLRQVVSHPNADAYLLSLAVRHGRPETRRLSCRHPRANGRVRRLSRFFLLRAVFPEAWERNRGKLPRRQAMPGMSLVPLPTETASPHPLLRFHLLAAPPPPTSVSGLFLGLRFLLPAAFLAAGSDSWQERLAAALSPYTLPWVRRRLTRDANRWVRAAASLPPARRRAVRAQL